MSFIYLDIKVDRDTLHLVHFKAKLLQDFYNNPKPFLKIKILNYLLKNKFRSYPENFTFFLTFQKRKSGKNDFEFSVETPVASKPTTNCQTKDYVHKPYSKRDRKFDNSAERKLWYGYFATDFKFCHYYVHNEIS